MSSSEAAPAPGLRAELRLRRERRRLLARRERMIYDLGGLGLELARRDLLEQPAMRARAALIAKLDEELRVVTERLEAAALRRGGGASASVQDAVRCPSCGAPHEGTSNFCGHCGARLSAPAPDSRAS